MKLVVFGLTISSSWGNGHATLWRGLCRALAQRGHRIVFYERDVPYYAGSRDFFELPDGELVLYDNWEAVRPRAARDAADADAAVVTSYCPDGIAATDLILSEGHALTVFYDLDTPITLARLEQGETVAYIGPDGLHGFDLVLSYTGGKALDELSGRLGARRVAPLYGHVDPDVHRPVEKRGHYDSHLSYLGTYAADRQDALNTLMVEAAKCRPEQRFLIGGALYPQDFPWAPNIFFVRHLPPTEHAAFFSSSRLTLNVTRRPMAEMGWCPSGRLFEAAACGTALLSDAWEGLETFFEPGSEIMVAASTDEALAALDLDDAEIRRMASAARDRTLSEHSSTRRAEQLIDMLSSARTTPLSSAMEA